MGKRNFLSLNLPSDEFSKLSPFSLARGWTIRLGLRKSRRRTRKRCRSVSKTNHWVCRAIGELSRFGSPVTGLSTVSRLGAQPIASGGRLLSAILIASPLAISSRSTLTRRSRKRSGFFYFFSLISRVRLVINCSREIFSSLPLTRDSTVSLFSLTSLSPRTMR